MRRSVLVIVLAAAGCGGGHSDRCAPASDGLVSSVETGLTVSGGGSLGSGQVVKSNAFPTLWFLAARVSGPGMSGKDVGVWATSDDTGHGMIWSVDGMAHEFSDWPKGPATMSDDGASIAQGCAKG